MRTNEGTTVQIATEQTDMQVNDCVFIEQTRQTANMQRASSAACTPEAAAVMQEPEMVEEMDEEASGCAAAKQQLADAETDAELERAVQKVRLLCYD